MAHPIVALDVQGSSPQRAKTYEEFQAEYRDKTSPDYLWEFEYYLHYPRASEQILRRAAFETVRTKILQLSTPGSKVSLVVEAVGSFGLGTWTEDSDIDVLCIGSVSPATFFSLAIQCFRNANAEDILISRISGSSFSSSASSIQLLVHGKPLDIQYCAASRIAEDWPAGLGLPSTDPCFQLPRDSLIKLNAVCDLQSLKKITQAIPAFEVACRFLINWAKARGIYAPHFGFLGGSHVVMLLYRSVKMNDRERPGSSAVASPRQIIRGFFSHYASFDWKTTTVEQPDSYASDDESYMRMDDEHMVILGLHAPFENLASGVTASAVRTIAGEIRRAHLIFEGVLPPKRSRWVEKSIIAACTEHGLATFPETYDVYMQLGLYHWGKKGNAFRTWVESEVPSLLADLELRSSTSLTRFWPERFGGGGEGSWRAYYTIGVRFAEGTTSDDNLFGLLTDFAQRLQEHVAHPDPNNSKIYAMTSKGSDVYISLDFQKWGTDVVEADLSGFVEEDQALDATDRRDVPKLNDIESRQQPVNGKLRPALDILNRLLWDDEFNKSDYIVGYEDRHLGARELPLEQWKFEATDENFIPQHRILYFRDKQRDVRVWDRKRHVDEITKRGEKV